MNAIRKKTAMLILSGTALVVAGAATLPGSADRRDAARYRRPIVIGYGGHLSVDSMPIPSGLELRHVGTEAWTLQSKAAAPEGPEVPGSTQANRKGP